MRLVRPMRQTRLSEARLLTYEIGNYRARVCLKCRAVGQDDNSYRVQIKADLKVEKILGCRCLID